MYDEPHSPPQPRSRRLPLVAAAMAAFVGLAAFGVAVVAGGQPSAAGLAIPLVSTATPAPGTGWAGGPHGDGGWMGPRGAHMARGIMPGDITIAAVNGTQLSLKTADGWTRTIDASGATVTRGGQTVALSTLQAGDQITFRESRQSDGTYKIDSIVVVLPQVDGTVTAVDASSVTVKQFDGTSKTVQLTSATTYRLAGQTATVSALVSGVRVDIQGTVASDGTFTAATVDIAPASVAGTVSAKAGSSLTVKDRAGTSVTINVTSSTTFQVSGVTNAGLANIAVGDVILAQGTLNADGSLNATTVRTGVPGAFGRGPAMGGPGMRGMWGAGGAGPGPANPGSPGSNGGTSGT